MSGNKTDVKQSVKITECIMLSELLTVNWQQTAKITEVANPLGSKRCQKHWVAKGPIIGRERTTREKSRSRKVHKSIFSYCLLLHIKDFNCFLLRDPVNFNCFLSHFNWVNTQIHSLIRVLAPIEI